MPNSFQQPEYRPSGGRSYMSGDNFGSGPMGLPIRRHMRNGQPAGFQIQFQDEWMDMDAFNDPMFQSAFFEPWKRKQGEGGPPRFPGYGGGRGGPVGSRSSRGMSFDPAMLDAIMAGG